jgi:hypothetical protein
MSIIDVSRYLALANGIAALVSALAAFINAIVTVFTAGNTTGNFKTKYKIALS